MATRRPSPLHAGRFAEHYVKMRCAQVGLDVYASEVDDRGIDFIIRTSDRRYFDVQVKAVSKWNYAFMRKAHFKLDPFTLLALVVLDDSHGPELFLIPSLAWEVSSALLVSRDYGGGLKSPPEWGINLSAKNAHLLDEFRFEEMVEELFPER